MTDMQETIGFRWKSGDDFLVFAGLQVVGDDLADKI